MTQFYSVVVEREDNGSFSAWVAGLPGVYAAADTAARAKRAIRSALKAHLEALTAAGQPSAPSASVLVLRYDAATARQQPRLQFVGPGTLLGRLRSPAKASASRRNGARGGRPARASSSRTT